MAARSGFIPGGITKFFRLGDGSALLSLERVTGAATIPSEDPILSSELFCIDGGVGGITRSLLVSLITGGGGGVLSLGCNIDAGGGGNPMGNVGCLLGLSCPCSSEPDLLDTLLLTFSDKSFKGTTVEDETYSFFPSLFTIPPPDSSDPTDLLEFVDGSDVAVNCSTCFPGDFLDSLICFFSRSAMASFRPYA